MCIIAYDPKGVKIKDEIIRIMFANNTDWAGFMYKLKGKPIEIRKGFMTVDDLLEAYHKIPVNVENAVHCRLAASGRISVDCCHHFPVRADISDMKKESDSAEIAVMHNGTIANCTPIEGMESECSDTVIFTAELLYNLKRVLDSQYVKKNIMEIIGASRLLIFRKKGRTLMFENWYMKERIFYSENVHAYYFDRYVG